MCDPGPDMEKKQCSEFLKAGSCFSDSHCCSKRSDDKAVVRTRPAMMKDAGSSLVLSTSPTNSLFPWTSLILFPDFSTMPSDCIWFSLLKDQLNWKLKVSLSTPHTQSLHRTWPGTCTEFNVHTETNVCLIHAEHDWHFHKPCWNQCLIFLLIVFSELTGVYSRTQTLKCFGGLGRPTSEPRFSLQLADFFNGPHQQTNPHDLMLSSVHVCALDSSQMQPLLLMAAK